MYTGSCARHRGGGNKQESPWCLVEESALPSLSETLEFRVKLHALGSEEK